MITSSLLTTVVPLMQPFLQYWSDVSTEMDQPFLCGITGDRPKWQITSASLLLNTENLTLGIQFASCCACWNPVKFVLWKCFKDLDWHELGRVQLLKDLMHLFRNCCLCPKVISTADDPADVLMTAAPSCRKLDYIWTLEMTREKHCYEKNLLCLQTAWKWKLDREQELDSGIIYNWDFSESEAWWEEEDKLSVPRRWGRKEIRSC